MGFEDFRPLDPTGRNVQVPDPDIRGLQSEPHALFCSTQGGNGLTPLSNVGAGTERAGHMSFVVAQQPVVPLDEAFLTGLSR